MISAVIMMLLLGFLVAVALFPKSALGALLTESVVIPVARYLASVTTLHLMIGFATLLILPFSFQLLLLTGSIDLLILYVTHTALYADFLLSSIVLVTAARVSGVWKYCSAAARKTRMLLGSSKASE